VLHLDFILALALVVAAVACSLGAVIRRQTLCLVAVVTSCLLKLSLRFGCSCKETGPRAPLQKRYFTNLAETLP
jgi:hypothetical protein